MKFSYYKKRGIISQNWYNPNSTVATTFNPNATIIGYLNAIEFEFSNTNVELWGRKGLDYGKVKVTVYPERIPGSGIFSLIAEKTIDNIDMYFNGADTNALIAKVQGLPNGKHKVRLEAKGTKNASATGYAMDFDYARVFHAVELIFTGTEVDYWGWKYNNGGGVDVSIDGGTVTRIATYAPVPAITDGVVTAINTLIKGYSGLTLGSHRLTVEATGITPLNNLSINGFEYVNSSGSTIYVNDSPQIGQAGLTYISGGGGWTSDPVNSWTFGGSNALFIQNTNTSSTYNLKYIYANPVGQSNTGGSLLGNWVNYPSPDSTYTYNYNNLPGKAIEFDFSGTNVELWGRKGQQWGIHKVTVYPETSPGSGLFSSIPETEYSFSTWSAATPVKNTVNSNNFDMYFNGADTNALIAKLQGLPNKKHKIRLEASGTKNPSAIDDLMDFDYFKVYPAVEYSFTGLNILYKALKDNNQGKVDISIDGGIPTRYDLYSSSANFDFIAKYIFNSRTNHRITIEGTGEKNPNSSD